jgi:hypothetical protein
MTREGRVSRALGMMRSLHFEYTCSSDDRLPVGASEGVGLGWVLFWFRSAMDRFIIDLSRVFGPEEVHCPRPR